MNTRVYNAMLHKIAKDEDRKARLVPDRVEDESPIDVDEDLIDSAEADIEDTVGSQYDSKKRGFYDGTSLDKWYTPGGLTHNLKVTAKQAKKRANEYIDAGKQQSKEYINKGVDATKKGLKKADEALGGGLGGSIGALGGGLVGALIAAKLAKKLSGGKKALAILAGLGLGGVGGYKIGDSVSNAVKKAEAKKAEKADA